MANRADASMLAAPNAISAFRAQCDLREGIAKTVAWFIAHRASSREVAVGQNP